MDVQNLLPRPFFIGSTGTTKFSRGERPRLGQGISLAANGEPGDTITGIPDWLYHSDPQFRKEELAGRILVTFSSERTSGVVQPEIDAIVAGSGGAETIPIQEAAHLTKKTSWVTISSVTIDFDRLTANDPRVVWDQVQAPGGPESAEVRLYNETDAAVMASQTGIMTTGPRTMIIGAFPAGAKTVLLQHRVTGGAVATEIKGGTLQTGLI